MGERWAAPLVAARLYVAVALQQGHHSLSVATG